MHLNNDMKRLVIAALCAVDCEKCPYDVTTCHNICETMAEKVGRAEHVIIQE